MKSKAGNIEDIRVVEEGIAGRSELAMKTPFVINSNYSFCAMQ